MAMALYTEYARQSTSALHAALVNYLCLLHLQRRDLLECTASTLQGKAFSVSPKYPLLVAKKTLVFRHQPFPSTHNSLTLTWVKELLQFADPRQPHAVHTRFMCAVVSGRALGIWNLNSKRSIKHCREKLILQACTVLNVCIGLLSNSLQ